MTHAANHSVPEQGKLRRALAAVFAKLQAMEYTGFDYTLDRIERLERGVGQLKEELRQRRNTGPVDTHNGSAAGLEQAPKADYGAAPSPPNQRPSYPRKES